MAQLVRYNLVGACNTALAYGVYAGAYYLIQNYAIASFISLIFGICVSFVTLGRYVFFRQLEGRFGKFVALWLCLYVVNLGLIAALMTLGLNAYWAGLASAIPIIAGAFVIQKLYIFR